MKHFVFYTILFICCSCTSQKNSKTYTQKLSDSLNYRAKYYLETNKLDSAQYYIDQALVLDSTNYAAYNNRAVLNFKLNGPSKTVVADFEASLRINPGYSVALISLISYYDITRDYKKVIESYNRYNFQGESVDSLDLNSINKILNRALKFEKVIDNISVVNASIFFDSINNIIDQTHPTQQRFIDTLKHTIINILANKNSSINLPYLGKSLDSARKINNLEFNSISNINEIDSSIGYKQNVLNYCLSFQTAYKEDFPKFMYCLSTKELGIIKNCLTSLNLKLEKIKKADKNFNKAKENFRTKYKLD